MNIYGVIGIKSMEKEVLSSTPSSKLFLYPIFSIPATLGLPIPLSY